MLHPILDRLKELGYAVFDNGDYDLNIVGIRKKEGAVANKFDDVLHCIFKVNGQWRDHFWPITTEPGHHYMMSKDRQLNPAGTAILVPGQYRGVYRIDKHGKSRYEALCQRNGKVKVWRDGNLDSEHDYGDNEQEGYFGINIHAASSSPYRRDQVRDAVGVWSAGCQVFRSSIDFRSFMSCCRKQRKERNWSSFSYSLIEEF
jgi:hypothetical protein